VGRVAVVAGQQVILEQLKEADVHARVRQDAALQAQHQQGKRCVHGQHWVRR
jgi:hypothetical protein